MLNISILYFQHFSFWFHLYSTPFPSPQLWSWARDISRGNFISDFFKTIWSLTKLFDLLEITAKTSFIVCWVLKTFWWEFLWGREMGVMGGVRRRCDTVTAFIFLPKDPSSNPPSRPFSWPSIMHQIGWQIMLMLPSCQKSVLKSRFNTTFMFLPSMFWPYQQLLQQSFLPASYIRLDKKCHLPAKNLFWKVGSIRLLCFYPRVGSSSDPINNFYSSLSCQHHILLHVRERRIRQHHTFTHIWYLSYFYKTTICVN